MFWSKEKIGGSFASGLNFGLTSAVITTLGLMIGLISGTGLKLAVLGGILTIAIADALSDALGMHISKESQDSRKPKEIWAATLATFLAKFIFAITFIFPVLLFDLQSAILINFVWGALLITFLSLKIARDQNRRPGKIIGEHLLIAVLVIILSYLAGRWINLTFS